MSDQEDTSDALQDEQSVAREVAEAEFYRFCEAMDLDIDTTRMDADDLKNLNDAKRKLVRAMLAGSLVVNERGEPVYTPVASADKSPITFYEPTGASMIAMDKRKKGEDFAKLHAMMADMTRTNPVRFSKMNGRDLKICQTLVGLFLG